MPILGAQSSGTKVSPTAPTIGTATAGDGSASVTFTAPSFSKLPVTSYTVTSSPGNITGTGVSSPITVTGLTNGTSYTFTVTATNATGTSAASAASNSATPAVVYFLGYGGPSIRDNALDSSGNLYVATRDAVNGGYFTAKISPAGDFVWQKSLTNSTAYDEQAYGVGVDSSGNVFMTGATGTPSKFFLAKYNSSGTLQWQRRLEPSSNSSVGNKIVTDSSGNVYVGATFYDSGISQSVASVIKYNTSGTLQWTRYFAEAAGSSFGGIGIDSSNNLYISYGSSNYGYVVKYDSSGSYQWGVRTDSNFYSTKSTTDTSGNTYMYGTNYSAYQRPTIMKINSSGVKQWERELSAGTASSADDVAVDGSGNVYFTSYYYTGGSRSNLPVIAKYNTSGTIQWQRSFDSAQDDKDFKISVSSAGVIYINGTSDAAGSNGNILLKLPTDGSKTGTYTINGNSFSYTASSWTSSTTSIGLSSRTPPYNGALSSLTESTPTFTDGNRGYSITKQVI
jgi:hypothetical protein